MEKLAMQANEAGPAGCALPFPSLAPLWLAAIPFLYVAFVYFCLCSRPVQHMLSLIFSDVAFLSELATRAVPRAQDLLRDLPIKERMMSGVCNRR